MARSSAGSSEPASFTAERELAHLSGVDMNLLVPLAALLEEQSVTHAATRVGLSQSAMSHALGRLRRLLGDDLLVRQGNTMVLTKRAESLVGQVRRVLEQSTLILNPAPFNPATDKRIVTFATTTSIAFVFGPLLARTFAQHAPNVVMRLQTQGGQGQSVFAERGVDAVLLSQGPASPESQGVLSPYPSERIFDDRWVVLTSADVKGEHGRRDAREIIETEPHIMYAAERGQRLRPYEVLAEQGISYSVRAHVADNLLIPRLLVASRGVALQRFQVATEFHESHGLQLAEFPFQVSDLGVDLVWNPWMADVVFRDWLRDIVFEAAAPLRARQDLPE